MHKYKSLPLMLALLSPPNTEATAGPAHGDSAGDEHEISVLSNQTLDVQKRLFRSMKLARGGWGRVHGHAPLLRCSTRPRHRGENGAWQQVGMLARPHGGAGCPLKPGKW